MATPARNPAASRPATARRWAVIGGLLVAFLAGAASAVAWLSLRPQPADADDGERHEGQRGLINPLLECSVGRSLGSARKVERAVRSHLAARRDGPLTHVSVYFRDLNNGPWFGVNERETFIPSSLNKVQIMLEILKATQSNPELLRRNVTFDAAKYEDPTVVPNIRASQHLVHGTTYSVGELVRRMIVYSDNAAAGMLIDTDRADQHFSLCPDDSAFPCPGGLLRYVSVIKYASVFRILFNASYLDRQLSELALQILAQSEYRGGLVAGVPAGVTVAHKFGEGTAGDVLQLHDCGIVYYPRSPYLLCVMTRGDSFDALARIISDVSRITYQEIARAQAPRP